MIGLSQSTSASDQENLRHLILKVTASDSALDTLLDRKLIERNSHQLLVTTQAFLDYAGLRDLVDLPPLEIVE